MKKRNAKKGVPISPDAHALLEHRITKYSLVSIPENSERAYLGDVDAYLNWGGILPAKPIDIAKYLVAHSDIHNVRTLRRRKSMLGKWHRENEHPDPTKHIMVDNTMKGISRIHNKPPRKVKPLTIRQVARLHQHLTRKIQNSEINSPQRRKALRDRAMLTVGFWGCLRSDELVNIQVSHVNVTRSYVRIYNPHTKTDVKVMGREKQLPTLPKYCPVSAVREYLREENPPKALFPSMTPKGELGLEAMRSRSVSDWLKSICKEARVQSKGLGSHSLRRGFATWYATQSNGDIWGLMAAGDWVNIETAAGYVDHNVNVSLIRRILSRASV